MVCSSLIFVYVVCAGLIGATSGDEACGAASVASTLEGSEYFGSSSRQTPAAVPFVAGATVTALSVFAVRIICCYYYYYYYHHYHH